MDDIQVRGGATAEELAALLAALAGGVRTGRDERPDGYARWRQERRRALAGRFPGRKITMS